LVGRLKAREEAGVAVAKRVVRGSELWEWELVLGAGRFGSPRESHAGEVGEARKRRMSLLERTASSHPLLERSTCLLFGI
jgi:hypothetical protein